MRVLRRVRFIALALLVALLQSGLPVPAYAKMAKDHGLMQEICTPSGAKKVVVDSDGGAREATPDSSHADHCQVCSVTGPTPLYALIQLHESARNPGLIRAGQTCLQAGTAVTIPPATAPSSGS
jgi:hypothetical protein